MQAPVACPDGLFRCCSKVTDAEVREDGALGWVGQKGMLRADLLL